MSKNRKYNKYLIMSLIYTLVTTFIFLMGISNNPNFDVFEFFMGLSSELVGLAIALSIVDTYIKAKNDYRQEKKQLKHISSIQTKSAEGAGSEDSFQIVHAKGSGTVKSTSVLVDKQTGVQYLFVVHEHGCACTPLLNKDGKPVINNG